MVKDGDLSILTSPDGYKFIVVEQDSEGGKDKTNLIKYHIAHNFHGVLIGIFLQSVLK